MIVSLLGLIISLFAYLIAFPDPRHRRFDIYAGLLAIHIAGAVAYWLLSFEEAMDAFMYYRDPFNFIKEDPFESGTYFVVHFVQMVRANLGGSFLDHFLLFQCFGMIGIALLIRTFGEIAESLNMQVPLHAYFVLALPGLHFWTAMIGKDGPMFMAVALTMWAALRIQRRIVWMAVAIIVMLLIRPHVAAISVAAIVGALLYSKQLSSNARIALAPLALIALVLVVAKAGERFNVTLDLDSLSNFFDEQQSHEDEYGSGSALQDKAFPIKVWSLLFRPFFIDQPGMMAKVVSAENAFLLYVFGYIAVHWRMVLRLAKNVYFISYCMLFAPVLIVLLALVNYNIGLGLRQKMMAIPAVLLIYVTIYMYKRHLAAGALQTSGSAVAGQVAPSVPARA